MSLQIRRGTNAQRVALGGLAAGELGFETDTEDVYIGAVAGDELISDKSARDFLNGQDQAVKTTSSPTFAAVTAGRFLTPNIDDLRIGYLAGQANTAGMLIAIGNEAAQSVIAGNFLIAIGYGALRANVAGSRNVAVGYYAMGSNVAGNYCTAVGHEALETSNVNSCSAFGSYALFLNQTGQNDAFGVSALRQCLIGSLNAAFGCGVLTYELGSFNCGFGNNTLHFATTPNSNSGFGFEAMFYNQTSPANTAVGSHSLYELQSGIGKNCAFGNDALYASLTTYGSIGIGWYADYFSPDTIGVLALSNASANLEIGDYYYKVAFILNGITSVLSTSLSDVITTNAANREVTISSIPVYTGPLTCTGRRIYRTKVNTSSWGAIPVQMLFYLVDTIADNITTGYIDITADAALVTLSADPAYSIMVGYMPLTTDRTAYKSGQFVIGSGSGPISEMWIGKGVYAATPISVLISANGASGANVAGADLVLSGGPGTGSAVGGKVILSTAPAGGAGSLWNAIVARLTVNPNGVIGIPLPTAYANNAAAQAGGLAVGDIYRTNADPSVLCIRSA